MQHRKLGDSDLEVSEIALGSWLTYGADVGVEATRKCTEEALDQGITFFDTANWYGLGAAEEVWGNILSAHRRDSYVLATKLYFPMSDTDFGLSAKQIAKQIDASLRRLRVDYVDLYQAHRFDSDTPLEETLKAFQDVVSAGKARYIGFSEWTPEQIEAAVDIAGGDLFVASQPQYSMLWRAPEDQVFPLCDQYGISQIAWSPLAQGVLTGKYLAGQPVPAASRAANAEARADMEFLDDASLHAVSELSTLASELGLTLAQLALAWVLRRHDVAAVITGASRPEQVRENVRSSGVVLDSSALNAIEDALGDIPVRRQTLADLATPGITRRGKV